MNSRSEREGALTRRCEMRGNTDSLITHINQTIYSITSEDGKSSWICVDMIPYYGLPNINISLFRHGLGKRVSRLGVNLFTRAFCNFEALNEFDISIQEACGHIRSTISEITSTRQCSYRYIIFRVMLNIVAALTFNSMVKTTISPDGYTKRKKGKEGWSAVINFLRLPLMVAARRTPREENHKYHSKTWQLIIISAQVISRWCTTDNHHKGTQLWLLW